MDDESAVIADENVKYGIYHCDFADIHFKHGIYLSRI